MLQKIRSLSALKVLKLVDDADSFSPDSVFLFLKHKIRMTPLPSLYFRISGVFLNRIKSSYILLPVKAS